MKVSQATSNRAPIIGVYGGEGGGKSTLASKFPKPLAFLLERGLPRGITMNAVEDAGSFEAIMAALREIYANGTEYQTLVFDTIDALEALLLAALCAENRWKSIETPPYGKGFVLADDWWRRFLRAITAIRDKHNMTVVMTCHATIERVDDPRAPSYTSYLPRLHKRARGLVMDCCDAVFFLSTDLHVVTEGEGFRERHRANASPQRFIFTEARPAFAAKNRFGMPPKLPVPLDLDFGTIAQFWAN